MGHPVLVCCGNVSGSLPNFNETLGIIVILRTKSCLFGDFFDRNVFGNHRICTPSLIYSKDVLLLGVLLLEMFFFWFLSRTVIQWVWLMTSSYPSPTAPMTTPTSSSCPTVTHKKKIQRSSDHIGPCLTVCKREIVKAKPKALELASGRTSHPACRLQLYHYKLGCHKSHIRPRSSVVYLSPIVIFYSLAPVRGLLLLYRRCAASEFQWFCFDANVRHCGLYVCHALSAQLYCISSRKQSPMQQKGLMRRTTRLLKRKKKWKNDDLLTFRPVWDISRVKVRHLLLRTDTWIQEVLMATGWWYNFWLIVYNHQWGFREPSACCGMLK